MRPPMGNPYGQQPQPGMMYAGGTPGFYNQPRPSMFPGFGPQPMRPGQMNNWQMPPVQGRPRANNGGSMFSPMPGYGGGIGSLFGGYGGSPWSGFGQPFGSVGGPFGAPSQGNGMAAMQGWQQRSLPNRMAQQFNRNFGLFGNR